MKTTGIRTTTYEHGDFLIDIVEMEDSYEAWLCLKNYGTKSLMFGSGKETVTADEFLSLIEASLAEYKLDYQKYLA